MIRAVKAEDADQIIEIYNYYVKNTVITFEEEAVSNSEMKNRIVSYTAEYPWFVYEEDGRIFGYCYVSKWKGRTAYRYSAETTIYVDRSCKGRGIGSLLYKELINESRRRGIHALIAVITLPNDSSRRLQERYGFRKTAEFSQVGRKFDKWLDIGCWELILESTE